MSLTIRILATITEARMFLLLPAAGIYIIYGTVGFPASLAKFTEHMVLHSNRITEDWPCCRH